MPAPDLSLILPTRARAPLARQALDSIAATVHRPERLEVVLYVDLDDVGSHALDHPALPIVKLIRPRARMGAITQACYAAASGRYVMLFNDDVICRTPAWDAIVLARFETVADDVALVWGNDLFRGAELPSHPILSRTVCEIMGGVCPPSYRRDYIDTHIYDIFRTLRSLGHDRLAYLPDVVFEHMHVEAGKAAFDSTSVKLRKADDELTYIAWAEERQRAAALCARHIARVERAPLRPAVLDPARRCRP
jgi:hypothetical protein